MNKRNILVALGIIVCVFFVGMVAFMGGCTGSAVEEAAVDGGATTTLAPGATTTLAPGATTTLAPGATTTLAPGAPTTTVAGGGGGGGDSVTTTTAVDVTTTTLPKLANPTFSVAAGDFSQRTLDVGFDSIPEGATVYYTEDGSDPVTSVFRKPYVGAITISRSTLIRGIAERAGYRSSDVVQAQYNLYWWQAVGNSAGTNVNVLAIDNTGKLYAGRDDDVYVFSGGEWTGVNEVEPIGGHVYALAFDINNNLYVGGDFVNIGGPNGDNIVRWNSSAPAVWQPLGLGAPGIVRTIFNKGTTVYVGGDFLNMVGDADFAYIAAWDGVWTDYKAGMTGPVYAIDDNYIGGNFDNCAGMEMGDNVVFYNAELDDYQTLGEELNDSVYAVKKIAADYVVVGGAFTKSGDVAMSHIAQWHSSFFGWLFQPLGTGLNDTVYALAVDAAGNIYAGGSFTDAGSAAGDRIAKWNGSAWSALGNGLGGIVRAIAIDSAGNIYVGGDFTNAGGVEAADYIAKWGKL